MQERAQDPDSDARAAGLAFPFGDWEQLRASFLHQAARSSFIQAQLERSGLTAEAAVVDPGSWRRLQPIDKHHLITDQEADPPFGSRRAVPEAEISLVVESSGSTGKGREIHYVTRGDFEHGARHWARYLAGMGVGPDDVVALTFPIGMAGGGVRHWHAYAELGAKVLRIGGLETERKLDAIRYYRATTLVATPAYVDRLGAMCDERGIEPRELPVARLVVATQSLSADWIRDTEDRWGAKLYEWYGTSAGIAAFGCERGMLDTKGMRGTLHWNPQTAVQEVVDPESGEPVRDGARGEMIGTPLLNAAEPIYRMSTGDEVCFRAPGTCPCGSPWPGIESGTVRRLDAMFKVKGINVWPAQVEASLSELADVLDYRVRIWQDDARRERVSIELLEGSKSGGDLGRRASAMLRRTTGLAFEVGTHPDRATWSQQTGGEAAKARRWVDERLGA